MPRSLAFASRLLLALALLVVAWAATLAPATAQSGSSLTITFLSCPPGGDWTAPPAGCEEVVAAPESAVLSGPDWVQRVQESERNGDGAYTVSVPAEGTVGLVNFYSPDHNAFTFDGVDSISRWYGEVAVGPGESRDITVYYWNGPVDLIMPAENSFVVNAMTCGEGVDPTVDASGCVPTDADVPGLEIGTSPLSDTDMDDYLTRDGGTFTYADLPAYTQAQVVVHQPLAGYDEVFVTGDAQVIEDDAATAYLLRNESQTVNVYYHGPNDEPAPAPTAEPDADTGTLRLYLLSCPPGVIPHDDPGRCTETLEDDGTAMVSFPETGERLSLTRFERDETGAYVIPDIESSVTISGVMPVEHDRIATDADQINGEEVVYNVESGETRDGTLYYYDEN